MSGLTLESYWFIAQGIGVTISYTLLSLMGGIFIGAALALLRYNKVAVLFIQAYISILRGTPLLVQLTLVYFVLPAITGVSVSIFFAGIVAFSLNSSAYIAEICRAGLNSVDKGQFEVSHALHIPTFFMWKDIILPQALKTIFPALINESISLLKETALISTLGGQDIMRRAQMVSAEHYTFIEPLCIAALCYYVLTFSLDKVGKKIEKVWDYDISKRAL